MWDWKRLWQGLTPVEGREHWPKVGDVPKEDDKPDWRGVIRNNVIELPAPGKYEFGLPQDPKYFWFDTPDYADPFKKLWYSFKFFTVTALASHNIFGIVENRPFTVKDNLSLFKRFFVPWWVGGMTASLFVITIANLRDRKDDYYNYLAAGFLAGSVVGRRNYIKWFRSVLVWTPLTVLVKHNAEINGILVPRGPNYRARNITLSGQSTEHGFWSGDLRLGLRTTPGDPGRDVRRIA